MGLVSCCLLQLKCSWALDSFPHRLAPWTVISFLPEAGVIYTLFVCTSSVHMVLRPWNQILFAHTPVKNKGGSSVGELNSLPVSKQSGSYLGRADPAPLNSL